MRISFFIVLLALSNIARASVKPTQPGLACRSNIEALRVFAGNHAQREAVENLLVSYNRLDEIASIERDDQPDRDRAIDLAHEQVTNTLKRVGQFVPAERIQIVSALCLDEQI